MTAVLLTTLFAASALIAAAAMTASWRRYGRAALALREQLTGCAEWREVDVRLTEITARSNATVLRPRFTPTAGLAPAGRPARPSALPAAA